MSLNFMVLSPADAADFIYETLSDERTSRHRIMLHGEPGVGKTSILDQVGRRMNAEIRSMHLSQFEGPDFRGLTMVDVANMTTVHMRPDWLPEYTTDPDAPKIIILLDEILGVHDATRKAAFQLILEHRIGPFQLGPNVYLVAAGNTAEDGTNIYEMDAATADRFCHVKFEATVEGFLEHGRENNFHPAILAFIANNGSALTPSSEDHENGNIARPSPRSLERASETLYRGYSRKQLRDASLKGWLGQAVATLLINDLDDEAGRFDLEALIAAPEHQRQYPTTAFGTYTLAQSLAAYAKDAEKLDVALTVMLAMPDDLHGAIEECKTAFFFAIEKKLREWGLLMKYAIDPRITRFIEKLDQIIDQADRANPGDQPALIPAAA